MSKIGLSIIILVFAYRIFLLMIFKYKKLFDRLSLDQCPPIELFEIDIEAFRFSHNPIENDLNFLPNYLYDEKRKRPTRGIQKQELCERCNLSFFTSLDIALKKLVDYREGLEKKHGEFIFYTHIAKGNIDKKDGLATKIKKHHFMFYEYEDCDFKKAFAVLDIPI